MLKVFISSTCYDLKEVRNNLKSELEKAGYDATISEKNAFVNTSKDNIENCLANVKDSDIIIHIIEKKYGSYVPEQSLKSIKINDELIDSENFKINFENGNISISQAEVLAALQEGIPVYFFVEDIIKSDLKKYNDTTKRNEIKALENILKRGGYQEGTIKYIFDWCNYINSIGKWIFSFKDSKDIFKQFTMQNIQRYKELLYKERMLKVKVDNLSEISNTIFYPSYQLIDWSVLLNDAKTVNLCIFFTGSEWDALNFPKIRKYIEDGGIMNIYLPNPEILRNKFFESQIIREDYKNKIFRTYKKYNQLGKGLKVKFIDEGFNYMFAKKKKKTIINNKPEQCFVYSAYVNNDYESEYPATVITDVQVSSSMIESYINEEIEFVIKQKELPAFEEDRYLTWDIENNRVFVSISFNCDGACKFCYVDSILDKKQPRNITKLGGVLADFILYDERFKFGVNGTKIMIGAFSEPLHRRSIEDTIDFIQKIAPKGNIIHIATRIGFHNPKPFDNKYNVLINYSFSTFNSKYELNNHKSRFENAKNLIKNKYNVAFYIRPIIPKITINDLEELMEKLDDINVKDITVGELYFDDKIKENMNIIEIKNTTKKTLVLDYGKHLIKNKSEDYDLVIEKLKKRGFNVYESSQELIDDYVRKINEEKY
jgi:DNA repair photolyase